MDARELTSASEIVKELGGNTAVARLTDRKAPQVVSNWISDNSFPPNTFLVLNAELRARGCRAPSSLWRMLEPTEGRAAS